MNETLLKLSATDAEDVQVIAAMLQDAIAPVCDMAYRPAERAFVMVVHRFRWERMKDAREPIDVPCFERVHCVLEVEGAEAVRQHGFHKTEACGMLDLLTLLLEDDGLRIVFAGDAEVGIKLGRWKLRVRDFGEPWPVLCQPSHPA